MSIQAETMSDQTPASQDSDKEAETFEDAQDDTPRPSSSSLKTTTSASRSSSTARLQTTDATPSDPQLPNGKAEGDANGQNHAESASPAKSPSFNAQRMVDDVSLQEGSEHEAVSPRSYSPAPKLPPRQPSSLSQQGLSGTLPPTIFPPPPLRPPEQTTSTSSSSRPPIRKLTSPFSWLSRSTGSSDKKVNASPVATSSSTEKRNTTSSVSTLGSGLDSSGNKLEDETESDGSGRVASNRNSLRDRFKLLRLREEAGITPVEGDTEGNGTGSGGALAGLIGRTTNMGLGIGNPNVLAADKADVTPRRRGSSSVATPTGTAKALTLNTNLAPGTAAGMSAGPTDSAGPVDWDLWQSLVYEGPSVVRRTSAEELNRAIASGIPHAIRGVVWQILADSKNEDLEILYRELVARGTEKERSGRATPKLHHSDSHMNGIEREKESVASSASSVHSDLSSPKTPQPPASNATTEQSREGAIDRERLSKEDTAAIQKLEKTIRRDLGARTSYSKYVMAAGLQEGLFGVCKAYALFDEAVGYAQGMNFIAMPLLFNMPEAEAFCLLVRLMNKYGLREMFTHDMPGLHLHLYQFERLLEDFEPALYCHLHRRGVSPQLYATQWFLTLFAYRFPLQLVLRIYDLILSEGLETAILKFGIVLMQKNAQTLLGMKDMAALSTFLKERLFDVYIDKAPSSTSLLESGFFGSAGGIDKEIYRADTLVQDACTIHITPETLQAYEAEWVEQRRAEREREAELETLRSQNAALTLKVRAVEERAEKADADHVAAASSLVRAKVESEELQDANESLRGQVQALQRIVESQPEEVEQRLKSEMERIMQRNIEVQNENRALEEQLADAEKELVETKLRYAQVTSEHDALKQKCNNISMMLNS